MSAVLDEPVTPPTRWRIYSLAGSGHLIAVREAREEARLELARKVASDADELGVRR